MRPPRAVPDPNVLVAAAIAPRGVCGQLLGAAIDGRWQPVVSPHLLGELREVLARTKFRRWLTLDEARQFVRNVRDLADERPDPPPPVTRRSADPDDEYLLALAATANVTALISGDRHLTELTDLDPPIFPTFRLHHELPLPPSRWRGEDRLVRADVERDRRARRGRDATVVRWLRWIVQGVGVRPGAGRRRARRTTACCPATTRAVSRLSGDTRAATSGGLRATPRGLCASHPRRADGPRRRARAPRDRR